VSRNSLETVTQRARAGAQNQGAQGAGRSCGAQLGRLPNSKAYAPSPGSVNSPRSVFLSSRRPALGLARRTFGGSGRKARGKEKRGGSVGMGIGHGGRSVWAARQRVGLGGQVEKCALAATFEAVASAAGGLSPLWPRQPASGDGVGPSDAAVRPPYATQSSRAVRVRALPLARQLARKRSRRPRTSCALKRGNPPPRRRFNPRRGRGSSTAS
jgi:hypothetical protein